jgi:hypothetical protein
MKITYPAPNTVSIWIGAFTDDDDFDLAAEQDIEARLNLPAELSSMSEVAYDEEATSIRELLEGFSGWQSFIDDAVAAAEKANLKNANAALVGYHLRCSEAPSVWGNLTFLGSFQVPDLA